MTNEQKFKTSEERSAAFDAWCRKEEKCKKCGFETSRACAYCFNRWLSREADHDEVKSCPFCWSKCTVENVCTNEDQTSKYVCCTNDKCMYQSAIGKDAADAIEKHNRIRKALEAYAVNGGAKDKMLADMLKVCDILCPGHGGFEEQCLNCKCKALCDKYHSLQFEISEYREKVERGKAK